MLETLDLVNKKLAKEQKNLRFFSNAGFKSFFLTRDEKLLNLSTS